MADTLESDLRERWVPSPEAVRMADALLAAGFDTERPPRRERGVFTAHVLLNKDYGIWTEEVEVVPVDGVFLSREGAALAAKMEAARLHAADGTRAIGGYTWHMSPGNWAVWEDIVAVFPDRFSR